MPNGEWKTYAGFTDKRATQRRAEQEQVAIDRGGVGLVDRIAAHRRKPIAEHVADYAAALEGRNRTAKHTCA